MSKLAKILVYTTISLVGLIIITLAVLPFIIDPNDYKPDIIRLAKQHTGRELKIPGKIELSVFPWLGVKLGEVELANAAGFGKQPFARIDAVDVRVKLLPLLKKDIQVGRLSLNGLKLDLQRNRQGKTNWDDLAEKKSGTATTGKAEATEASAPAIAGLAVGGLKVSDAQLNWTDQQSGQSLKIESLNLETGEIANSEDFDIQLDTLFASHNPGVSGRLELETTANINLDAKRFTLSDLELNTGMKASDMPFKQVQAVLSNESLLLDQNKQTLVINKLVLATADMKLHGDAEVTQLDKTPRYKLNLDSNEFSLKQLARQMGLALPATADPKALQQLQLSTRLVGDTQQVSVQPLTLQLDDSKLQGNIQVRNFQKPAITYQLSLDEIDADRYLPPPATQNGSGKKSAPTSGSAAAAASTLLPVEQLRALNVKGDVKVARLKVTGVRSSNIQMTTSAQNGLLRLYPLQADMYEGHYKGDVRINVQGATPVLSMNEALSDVQVGPLLKDYQDIDKIEGKANLAARLTARGNSPMAIRKTLSGNASFQFLDGTVKGINLGAYQRKLNALLEKKPVPKETGPNETKFAEIKGTLQLSNGVAKNKDLTATLPFARVKGDGWADLARERVDYTVYSKFTSEVDIKRGKSYAQINKPALPVRITGKLLAPDIEVDYQAVLKALAKKEIEKKKTEAKEKVEKKLEEKLQDKLKDLFKF